MDNLTAPYGSLAFFLDLEPPNADFRADVVAGLSKAQKSLSPKYLYNEQGSLIFDKITEIDAYYPTRTEASIMDDNRGAIAKSIGPDVNILEYGAGSTEKIKRLLNLLEKPSSYVAVDISRDYLIDAMTEFASSDDAPPMGAICADFTQDITVPRAMIPIENAALTSSWLGYFPGSTIGNFSPTDAQAFLNRAANTLGSGSRMLIGVDLYKDERILHAAYDDPEGVTAAFNLNVLRRITRELDAEAAPSDFEHLAIVNAVEGRVEMHLRAKRETEIIIDGETFTFAKGETLHTENSYKYTQPRLTSLLSPTPWRAREIWTDPQGWFAVCLICNTQ
ncbi:MAG: L-histidine N(alpha)-methyltransferase [Pseudomonadota bacterium]